MMAVKPFLELYQWQAKQEGEHLPLKRGKIQTVTFAAHARKQF